MSRYEFVSKYGLYYLFDHAVKIYRFRRRLRDGWLKALYRSIRFAGTC
jgi:hypothetical protein